MQKFIVVAFVLTACFVASNYGYTNSQKSQIQSQLVTAGLACVKTYPITYSDVKAFSKKIIPDNTNAKCFSACMFQKTGVMDDAGKVSTATALENAQKVFKGYDEQIKNITAVMEKCAEVNNIETSDGDKGCDRAKLAFECINETAPKYGLSLDF